VKIAFAMAGAIAGVLASPMPPEDFARHEIGLDDRHLVDAQRS